MTPADETALNEIKHDLISVKKKFDKVGGQLGMRASEKLVEAKSGIIRAGRKINKILDGIDK